MTGKKHRRHYMVMCTSLTIGMSLLFMITAYAGQWKRDSRGWWYQNEDGTYSKNTWQYINGKWYCFDGTGYMLHDTWLDDYYLGTDGAMLTNTTTPDGYFVRADGRWDRNPAHTGNNMTVASLETATLNLLHGTWAIDTEYTQKANKVSMMTLFGTGFKYGNEMKFNKNDMSYSTYAGIGYGGEGTFSVNGNVIRYSIRNYEDGNKEAGEMLIKQINGKTYIVEDFYDEYKLYWIK